MAFASIDCILVFSLGTHVTILALPFSVYLRLFVCLNLSMNDILDNLSSVSCLFSLLFSHFLSLFPHFLFSLLSPSLRFSLPRLFFPFPSFLPLSLRSCYFQSSPSLFLSTSSHLLFLSFPFLSPLFSSLIPLLLRSRSFQSSQSPFSPSFTQIPFPSLSLPPIRAQKVHGDCHDGAAAPSLPVAGRTAAVGVVTAMALRPLLFCFIFRSESAVSQEMRRDEL